MKRTGMILAAWIIATAAAMAQMQPPKPAPELKKLDIFVGSWTLDGTMKPGMMGPGGSMTENEKCEWMEGSFYLVCRSDYKSSMGNGVGLSVMGYSADDKAYTYREFNSFGEFDDSRGSLDGDTWTWTNEEKNLLSAGGEQIVALFLSSGAKRMGERSEPTCGVEGSLPSPRALTRAAN